MAFDIDSIRLPVFIVRAGNEGFDYFDIHLFDAVEFGQLQKPVTLQLFRCGFVLHVRDRQGVGKPFLAQPCKQGGFSHALLTDQDKNRVKLDTGSVDAGNSGYQRFPRNRTNIRCIFCTEIVDQQSIQSGGPVPFQ